MSTVRVLTKSEAIAKARLAAPKASKPRGMNCWELAAYRRDQAKRRDAAFDREALGQWDRETRLIEAEDAAKSPQQAYSDATHGE